MRAILQVGSVDFLANHIAALNIDSCYVESFGKTYLGF